ncbi:MAG: hypothetical protein QOH48_1173 [Actinomycetota bacterium]|jgi:hypothetical protein|nr:hypothetical protein [Actinomycetota bacterium]
MQSQSRRRFGPIVKRILMAVAVKKGFDMYQEMRRPQKSSFLGRTAKLSMWAAGGGGIFYAFVSGKLRPMIDKVMGGSSSSSNSDSWSSHAPSASSHLSSSPSATSEIHAGASSTSSTADIDAHLQNSESSRI